MWVEWQTIKDLRPWDVIKLKTEEILSILVNNSYIDRLLCVWYNISKDIKKKGTNILIATCDSWNNALDISNDVYDIVYTDDIRNLPKDILDTYFVVIGMDAIKSWPDHDLTQFIKKLGYNFVAIS